MTVLSSPPRLLLLGAMQMHLPIIQRAKERGIYVITCDYLPENEGHKLADEAHFDSTTDLPAVLKLAQQTQANGIMTFNSDPAALTAAYVAEQLNLPGSGYTAVEIMSEKDKFRAFLAQHNFPVPRFAQYTSLERLTADLPNYHFPIMLKPVDSSGSKGVVRIDSPQDIPACFENALSFSRSKRIIVEEFIDPLGAQLHGDAFVKDGKIEFIYLGDHHFDATINNLVPISTTFPSVHLTADIKRVEEEVQRFISAVGFRQGGINIEARISAINGKVYLIEVGPRNGGNFTPIVIQHATGFDFMEACLNCALGLPHIPQQTQKKGWYAYLIPHSAEEGTLDHVYITPELESKLIARYDYVLPGGQVKSFRGSNAAVSVLIVRFDSQAEMLHTADNLGNYCQVLLRK